MKKLFLAGAALIAFASVHAQNLSLGPTAGFGHSWTNTDYGNDVDRKFHASPSIGAKLVYSFVSNWGISADARFASEGTTVKSGGDELRMRANYIRVPIQGIYFFGKYGNAIRPKVSLGPSVGFMVGGKSAYYEDGDKVSETNTKDVIKTFDLGLTAAAGANFRLAPNVWLNTDLAYYHGLLDVAKNDGAEARNRNIGINVGVLFGIGTVKK
jgi:hypothetical protein